MDQGATRARTDLVDGGGDKGFAGPGFAADQHGGVGVGDQINALHGLADRGGGADDVVMRALGRDRLLQIGVFLFQPVAQRGHLIQRVAQFAFVFLTLGDVAEDHHGARENLLVIDRGRDIFHADRFSVLAPKHLILDPVDLFKPEGPIDRAIMGMIDVSVQVVMVDHRMDVVAQQVLNGPAQHLLRGAVHECGLALGVDAVNPFARCVQDQLVLTFQFGKERLGPLPFQQARAENLGRLRLFGAPVKGMEVGQDHRHMIGLTRHGLGAQFDPQGRSIRPRQGDVARPAFSAVVHRVQKHDELGQVLAQILRKGGRGRRGRSGQQVRRLWRPVHDPVAAGIKHDHRMRDRGQKGIGRGQVEGHAESLGKVGVVQ